MFWRRRRLLELDPDPTKRLYKFLELSGQRLVAHDHKSALWKRLNYVLGGVAAIGSTLAGAAILADWWGRDVAGAIALCGGLLVAMVAFYDFDQRRCRPGWVARVAKAAPGRSVAVAKARHLDAR